MQYFVKLNCDNAAFEENPGVELARILRELAAKVEQFTFEHQTTTFPVRDINGNKVGEHGYQVLP